MRVRILVTGVDRFIGSHLSEALVRQGREVRALEITRSREIIASCSEEVS
jgi:nucleoside-diphosphate-sugar epimerase